MEFLLRRTYFPTGTNGDFLCDGTPVCHTIELPWKSNQNMVSCIPEGRYQLQRFKSSKHGIVLQVCDVPNRSAILLHKANYALRPVKQLEGCIAPVMELDAKRPGVGWNSGKALNKVLDLYFIALENDEEVFLTIVKK